MSKHALLFFVVLASCDLDSRAYEQSAGEPGRGPAVETNPGDPTRPPVEGARGVIVAPPSGGDPYLHSSTEAAMRGEPQPEAPGASVSGVGATLHGRHEPRTPPTSDRESRSPIQ